MKIIIVGGNGVIGKAIVEKLKGSHELIIGSPKTGDIRVDLGDCASIFSFFEKTGHFDALINAAGAAYRATVHQ